MYAIVMPDLIEVNIKAHSWVEGEVDRGERERESNRAKESAKGEGREQGLKI